jgi:hypothetical protein
MRLKMKNDRREFLKCCSLFLGAGCLGKLDIQAAELKNAGVKLDLDELTYCAFKCSPEKCILLKATLENDDKLRRKAYKEYKFKELDGIDYDPEKVFCFTCKEHEKPANVQIKRCDVRNCAVERGVRSCVECKDLAGCKKEIWERFPQQKAYALKLQKHWLEVEKGKLI